MVCSEERTSKKYPFDIQHRSIISYMAESSSDFNKLRENLTAKLKAILKQDDVLEKIAEADPVSLIHGLSQLELLVLTVIVGDITLPGQVTTVNDVKRSAERAGITNVGCNLAVRRLLQKELVFETTFWDEHGETHQGIGVSEDGWEWIDANDAQFLLHRPEKKKEGEIPLRGGGA
jgi:hypothetical protein